MQSTSQMAVTITEGLELANSNAPETLRRPVLTGDFLQRCYIRCGIPPRICVLSHESLVIDKRAEELWKNVLERATGPKKGVSTNRGLLLSGSQGSGKSTALYFLARSHVKKWLIDNPPTDSIGFPKIPVYIKYFKRWVRSEFAVDGKYNFNLIDEMLQSDAIFLDDLTFDNTHEAFRPVREFIEILVEELTHLVTPPPLHITTNNTGAEWDLLLGSQIVDRIAGHKLGLCEVIKCNWPSFRKE